MMPPNFLSLPPEILTLIVRYVTPDHLPHVAYRNPQDLPNLRLTCRAIHAVATPEFGRVCLSRCKFILSEYSLQGLVALTSHPILAPYLKTVSLGTHFLPLEFDHLAKGVLGDVAFGTENFMENIKHLSGMMQEMHSRRSRQIEFLNKGRGVEILTQALRNLKAKSLDVALGLYDDVCFRTGNLNENAHTKGYGYDEFHGPLLSDEDNWEWAGFSIYCDWVVDPMTPLRTILEASRCSAYPVRYWDFDLCYDHSFPLSGSNSSEAIRDGSFHRRIRQILTTQITLPRKWTLNPGIDFALRWWDQGDCCGLELEMRFITDVQRFECKSTNAHAGHMGQFERISSSYGSLRAALGHNMFREARFENIETQSREVIVFLRKHHKSLRRLEFSNVKLKGSHEEFLQLLRDYMSLDYLEWHDLVVDPVDTFEGSFQKKPKKYESGLFVGREQISAALNALVSDVPEMGFDDSEPIEFGWDGVSGAEGHWSDRSLMHDEEYVWDEQDQ